MRMLLLASVVLTGAVWADGERAFDVKPLARYEISFEAETRGRHTTAAYPYLAEIVHAGGAWARGRVGCPVPYFTVTFRDADGKDVRPAGSSDSRNVLVCEKRRRLGVEFRSPPSAAKAVFRWSCPDRRDTLLVTNIVFKAVERPATINVNPDFAHGADDYSGWGQGWNNDVRPDPLHPGRHMMVCGNRFDGGSVWTDWMPVEPGRRYRLEYDFQRTPDLPNGRSRVLFMTYESPAKSGGQWKGTLSRELAGGAVPKPGTYSFVVPEGVHCLRSLIENTVVRRYALVEEVAK